MGKIVLDYPLLAVAVHRPVEAKKDDFKVGWAQCGSEMYNIQQLNREPNQWIFGIVLNGETWEFAQLLQNTFTLFTQRYDIQELDILYSALETVYQFSLDGVSWNI